MSCMQEIINCNNIRQCLNNKDKNNPCFKITTHQKATYNNFKVPEPWSGSIETSPLLFLNLYPLSIVDEEYPTIKWPNKIVEDFFNNRFNGRIKKWVKDDLYPLTVHSNYKKQWNRPWSSIKSRANELFDKTEVLPGVDYSISYLVHCKTRKSYGVDDSLNECVKKHLSKVILNAKADVIVVMGAKTGTAFKNDLVSANHDGNVLGPIELKGKQRYIAFLPHPNHWGPRSFSELIQSESVNNIREHLNKANHEKFV